MPPERQVESILRHFGVVSFSNLRKRLPAAGRSLGDEALLDLLRSCGVLVCGTSSAATDLSKGCLGRL